MSGKLFECGYGAILREDVEVLEACLQRLIGGPGEVVVPHTISVCEIGMHDGGTARGIESFVNAYGCALSYIGIDPDDGTKRPRHVPAGGKVIVGDSAEVYGQVPDGLDIVWVDGCHCLNHVVLDTLHFAPKVRVGGFLCFHDVNPSCQGWGHQYHGPDTPEFAVDVVHALAALRFPWPGWELFMERCPDPKENIDCGTRAYRRVS